MSQSRPNELEAVQEDFITHWQAGDNPTLADYVETYPEYEREMTEFVVAFLGLFAVPADEEEGDLGVAEVAMRRGIDAALSEARSVPQRLEELSIEPAEFDRVVRFPLDALTFFHRHRVKVPLPFLSRLAAAAQLTLEQTQRMLAPQRTSLQNRATRAPSSKEVEFEELLETLRASGQLSEADYRFWKAECGLP